MGLGEDIKDLTRYGRESNPFGDVGKSEGGERVRSEGETTRGQIEKKLTTGPPEARGRWSERPEEGAKGPMAEKRERSECGVEWIRIEIEAERSGVEITHYG
jgi:hypothetical protein